VTIDESQFDATGRNISSAGWERAGWSRPVSPAITEQLCKTIVCHEERAKSLKDLIRAAMADPSPYLPESPMTPAERAAFNWGFAEGMNVVLEYIKSGQPAPR
jgi:hypothetical protein